jgi:Ca2+-binding RTX toxin-like protein
LGQDGSDYGIYAQRYDATGAARGGEFKVNTSTASRQAFPNATALPDGGWLVSWQSSGLDGALPGLFVQRYHVDGTASGPQVQVGTAAVWDAAAQAVLRDGSLALAWGTSLQEVAGLRMSLQVESQRTSGNDFVLATLKDGLWAGTAGDDFYVIDSTSDQVVERAAEGNDTVMSSISLVLPAHVENLMLTGASLTGRGNSLANRLQGNASANTLQGDEGHDTLDGGAGADTLIGGLGDDLYLVDHVGDVTVEGVGEGVDTVWAVVDVVLATGLEHSVLTGSGALSATGNALDNLMSGNSAANRLNGLAGDDTLIGGGGRDSIDGGDGADQIRVSGGSNVLAGGRGADLFVLSALMSQSNNIMDFEPFDVLQLEDLAAITAFSSGRGAMLVEGAIDYEVLATGTWLHIGLDDRRGADAAVWLDGFANASALSTAGNRLGTSLNRAPVVTELAPLAVRDRDVASGQLHQQGRWMVSDPDADALSFSIQGAGQALFGVQVMKGRYGDLLLNTQTGQYTYTSDQRAVAALSADAKEMFTLNVSDGVVSTSGLLEITVGAINDAPFAASSVSGWSVRSGAGEQRISLDGVFSDFETPGALALSVTGLPAGLTYDSAQKAILGSPSAVGVHNITVRVEDSAGGFSIHAIPMKVLTSGVRVAFEAQGWRGDQESVTVNAYAFKRVMENALVRVEFDFNASTSAFEAWVFSNQELASGSFQLDLAGLAVDSSLKFTLSQKASNWQSVANVQAGHATFIGYNTDLSDTTKALRAGDLIGVFAGTLQADELVGGWRLQRAEIGTQADDSPLRWDILPARQSSWQGLDEGAYALSATAPASARSSISAADAYETLRIALGIAQTERLVSGQEFVAADVNRDGRVSVFDALAIAKTAAGLLPMPSQVVLNGNTNWQALSAANVSYEETIVLGALSEGSHSVSLVGIQLGDVSAVTPL